MNADLKWNFHSIAALLRDMNLSRVVSSYSGSGDSGEISDIILFRGEEPGVLHADEMPRVEYRQKTSQYKPGEGFVYEYGAPVSTDFRTALSDITEEAIATSGHPGWQNNEGAEGSLTIHANGHAELEHISHFEDDMASSRDDTEFNTESDKVGPALAVLSQALAAAGAKKAVVQYSGADDSGSAYGIDVAGDRSVLNVQVVVPMPQQVYNWELRTNETVVRDVKCDFSSALADLSELAIADAGHEGYENEAGGHGTFTLHADGTALLEHTYNVMGSDTSSEDWNNPEEPDEPEDSDESEQ